MTIKTFNDATTREIQRVIRRDRSRPDGFEGLSPSEQLVSDTRVIRWARTTTSTDNPSYPATSANKFVVEFGDYAFDEEVITPETAVFTAYSPAYKRIAYSPVGWLAEGTIIRCTLHHGRWYILDSGSGRRLFGRLAENMCTTDASADCDELTEISSGATVANLTALNTFILAGENNDYVILEYIEAVNDWVIVQVKHKLVAVLVDVYVSGANLKGSYRDCALMYCGAQREENLETLTECP